MNSQNEQKEQLDELPAELLAAVRQSGRSVTVISAEIDRAILQQAEAQFSSRTTSRKTRLAAPAWVAIAASLVLGIFIVGKVEFTQPGADSLYSDANGSGSIDIADVLTLARAADTASQAELDRFAMRLVRLEAAGDST